MERTYNTLFMLSSLDGKISTGEVDERDVDKDFKNILGIKEGLKQYYDLESKTDKCSFNSGKVMAKIGVNTKRSPIKNNELSFVIVDNTHLNKQGVLNLAANLKKLFLVTKNPNHIGHTIKHNNLEIISYTKKIDFADLFKRLKKEYGIERVTIQSGGTLNSVLLRNNLLDEISVVLAPALVGGKDVPTLVDGANLVTESDLSKIKSLKLIAAKVLKNSYLQLNYKVANLHNI